MKSIKSYKMMALFALLTIFILFVFIKVNAVLLTDTLYNAPNVEASWSEKIEQDGKNIIEQVKDLEGKYIYCVASHTQNYKLEFGTQAYFEKIHRSINTPDFAPEPFNFLMLSMACYYPGSKELSKADQDPAGTPYYLVSQSIAWMVTESAFRKDEPFSEALQNLEILSITMPE